MTTLTTSIQKFTADFAASQGLSAEGRTRRRKAAVEELTAALFAEINAQMDPGEHCTLNPDDAETVLDWASEISRVMALIAGAIRGQGRLGRWSQGDVLLVQMLLTAACEDHLRDAFQDFALDEHEETPEAA